MNILQKIFTDYYEEIKYTLHPRASEMENIEKMINCGDPSFGECVTVRIFLFGAVSSKKRYLPTAPFL